jgi:hypothetical protein
MSSAELHFSSYTFPQMTIIEANQIWNDCYSSNDHSLWSKYTPEDRELAISVRNGKPAFYDIEAERIEARRAERDGWQTATWDGRF